MRRKCEIALAELRESPAKHQSHSDTVESVSKRAG